MDPWETIHRSLAIGAFLLLAASPAAAAPPSFRQTGNLLVMSNADVRIEYHLNAGTADFYWKSSKKISGFHAGARLSSGRVKSVNFSNRTWSVAGDDQVVVTAHAAGLPDMIQYFTLDQDDGFLTRVALSGTNLSANWMGPVVVDGSGGVDLGSYGDDRALFVPFDNDHFVRYNAGSINGSDTGHEVAAFYDNTSRHGLVVGSVTHDVWKTGIHWSGSNNKLDKLSVFGGVSDHGTWDVMPHGAVRGNTISSPTIFVGFGDDWRTVMDRFTDENTRFAPKLVWTNGAPFGWNSWGVTNYQNHISYAAAVAVSDSIHTNLQPYGFANHGVVYVNLDSYWDNMSRAQLRDFANHCRSNGQKPGIYWAPFAYWGSASAASNSFVPGTGHAWRYSQILLRAGNGHFISNDGGLAIDPTHPGTREMIRHYINLFTNDGFDYIKLDFLSHGALEGTHYDTNVTTGIEAYNQGMQYLSGQIHGRMFISESIAPLFPYRYADSRRIACDAEASKIGDTEYTMNSVAYGWWLGRLYAFNDPDLVVFGDGVDANEAQSRLISAAVTSGIFLDGDVLTNAASIARAQTCLTNAAINDVVRAHRPFLPVEGDSGNRAPNLFARRDGATWCIAVFNYSGVATNEAVNLARAGLPAGIFVATNLWDGATALVTNAFTVSLGARQSKLFRLAPINRPTQP